jgi:hypothetical protein
LFKTLGLSFLLLAMVVLGWGYWHMITHATLNLSLQDVSLKTDRQAYGQIVNADMVFMNADGTVLAAGKMREPYGVLSLLVLKSMIAAVMSDRQAAMLIRGNRGSVALK